MQAINVSKLTKDGKKYDFFPIARKYLLRMRNCPVVPLLTLSCPSSEHLDNLFEEVDKKISLEATTHLLHAILKAQVKSSFYKINIHTALSPAKIKALFSPVIKRADLIQTIYKNILERTRKKISSGSSISNKIPFKLPNLNFISPQSSMEDICSVPASPRTPFVTVCLRLCLY